MFYTGLLYHDGREIIFKDRKKSQFYDAGIGKYDTGKKGKITLVRCSFEISRFKKTKDESINTIYKSFIPPLAQKREWFLPFANPSI